MHNKIMIADNQLAITGGAPISAMNISTLAAISISATSMCWRRGPIVARLSQSFDSYWNGDEAFPLAALHAPDGDAKAAAGLRKILQDNWRKETQDGEIAAGLPPVAQQLKDGQIKLIWAAAELCRRCAFQDRCTSGVRRQQARHEP